MASSSITSKGQITIPCSLREKLRLQPGDKVLFEEKDGVITITPVDEDIESMAGCLAEDITKSANLDDMETDIHEGMSQSWKNKRKNNAGH